MGALTNAELEAAEVKGSEFLGQEPRASAARFDRNSGRITIDLANGCTYAFPADLVQDLQGAEDDDLETLEIDGLGFNLHWPNLDVDLFIPALVTGRFGSKAWMISELARYAGQVRSPAKTAAARANGAKGGRPRKSA